MKIDGVFSGGGVKAFAFIGCLQSLADHKFRVERVAGTSAGAIIAALITAQYKPDEITSLLEQLDLKQLLDPPIITNYFPFTKWYFLHYHMGIHRGERLEQWIAKQLAKKNIYTFKDIKDGYLKVITTDLTYRRLVVIPDDLNRFYQISPDHFSVATAVRMSAGFPYFFVPKQLKTGKQETCLFIDGGLVSNFPLWVFNRRQSRQKRPVIGVKLSDRKESNRKQTINNSFSLLQAMLSTMKQAHDHRFMSIDDQNIIYIPTAHLSPVDLTIDETTRHELIQSGKSSTDKFLKHWPT